MNRVLVISACAFWVIGCESASTAMDSETDAQASTAQSSSETSDVTERQAEVLGDADGVGTTGSDSTQPQTTDASAMSPGPDIQQPNDASATSSADAELPEAVNDISVSTDASDITGSESTDGAIGEDVGNPDEQCTEPNPEGCKYQGCPDGLVCDVSVGCLPSKCTCDESTGVWACTQDCSGGTCVAPGENSSACETKNPQGCVNTGCMPGYKCDTAEGCFPSSCTCDANVGLWVCTEDCGGGMCVPEDPTQTACSTSNPAGCVQTGCKEGFECDINEGDKPSFCECDAPKDEWVCSEDTDGGKCMPASMLEFPCTTPNPAGCATNQCPMGSMCDTSLGCYPSTCKCDLDVGEWVCADDCNGGMCVAAEDICGSPNPAGCALTGCPPGEACDLTLGDKPAACKCDPVEEEWICILDQKGGECVPKQEPLPLCEEPNPVGCVVAGCPDGFACDVLQGCEPSSCLCDVATGLWVCEPDCKGGICVPKDEPMPACPEPNPQGCAATGCGAGEICDTSAGCFPSACSCDEGSGSWICTGDCNGGQCMPDPMSECAPDSVVTVDGCFSWLEVYEILSSKLNTILQTYNACAVDTDCTLVSADTECKGTCQVSVSTGQVEGYLADKQEVSDAYCSANFVELCGYVTPDCGPAEPICDEGTCSAISVF